MLIAPAYAQSAAGGSDGGLMMLLPFVLIFFVFYFLIIRPQQQKVKQHRAMVQNLRRNDRVVTAGGVIGTVAKVVSDGEVILEIAEGVRVRQARGMITEVLAKTEPATGAPGGGQSAAPKPESGLGGVLDKLGLGGKK